MNNIAIYDKISELQGIRRPFRGLYAEHKSKSPDVNPSPKQKKGFWTKNRGKIIISLSLAVLFAYLISPYIDSENSAPALWSFLAYLYLVTPMIGIFLNKTEVVRVETEEDVQRTGKPRGAYIKLGHKLYRRSDCDRAPALTIASGTFALLFGGIFTYFKFNDFPVIKLMMHALILALPYAIYHILCFIADYPLCFFKMWAYAKSRTVTSGYATSDSRNSLAGYGSIMNDPYSSSIQRGATNYSDYWYREHYYNSSSYNNTNYKY